ncbi:TetR/AcrR family transcriptional regulator [Schnuerera sp. xch1]|uniref:TetR/AcrR family transcriptional regulator n=1 Tax=Schnuerera sp. xch1 TaxID=2874283 RepID=UPI001CBF57D8|nr:TetR/AcrR family transcriptional regulator [Schnuerera sp. xch1]MBZ2174449.1 TetR/AcrR family transcriptional regulator [Schnuerera sp. xch1]
MFEKFENLPEDKKKRIIDVCIEEFAEHGYAKGSTNEITKKAEISKGILFHYFKNKKNLYLYIVDYVMKYYIDIFIEEIRKMDSDDIFDTIKEISLIKIKAFSKDPMMYKFVANIFLSPPEEIEQDIKNRYFKLYEDSFKVLVEKFDTSKLRKDIDKKKAIELLFISLGGIADKYITEYKGREKEMIQNADKIIKDFEEYMHILKAGLYDETR